MTAVSTTFLVRSLLGGTKNLPLLVTSGRKRSLPDCTQDSRQFYQWLSCSISGVSVEHFEYSDVVTQLQTNFSSQSKLCTKGKAGRLHTMGSDPPTICMFL